MKENSSVRDAYMELYSDDELAHKINDVTFYDVFKTLDSYGSFYKLIGVYDSLIRERIFSMLAVVMVIDYEYIYDQWLQCNEG